jgi:hypothetical protein
MHYQFYISDDLVIKSSFIIEDAESFDDAFERAKYRTELGQKLLIGGVVWPYAPAGMVERPEKVDPTQLSDAELVEHCGHLNAYKNAEWASRMGMDSLDIASGAYRDSLEWEGHAYYALKVCEAEYFRRHPEQQPQEQR